MTWNYSKSYQLVMRFLSGLIGLTKELNGSKFKLEPFPPGVFEEYSIDNDGKAKLLRQERFHEIGSPEKPKFKPFVPFNSKITTKILFEY